MTIPKYLTKKSRKWTKDIDSLVVLEPHQEKMVIQAAVCLDRIEEARELIAAEGLTTKTRDGGRKAHPAVGIERDSKILFTRLCREIGLDIESVETYPRVPRRYGQEARK